MNCSVSSLVCRVVLKVMVSLGAGSNQEPVEGVEKGGNVRIMAG